MRLLVLASCLLLIAPVAAAGNPNQEITGNGTPFAGYRSIVADEGREAYDGLTPYVEGLVAGGAAELADDTAANTCWTVDWAVGEPIVGENFQGGCGPYDPASEEYQDTFDPFAWFGAWTDWILDKIV